MLHMNSLRGFRILKFFENDFYCYNTKSMQSAKIPSLHSSNAYFGYYIKLSDSEAQLLVLWRMWIIPSLPWFPGPLTHAW